MQRLCSDEDRHEGACIGLNETRLAPSRTFHHALLHMYIPADARYANQSRADTSFVFLFSSYRWRVRDNQEWLHRGIINGRMRRNRRNDVIQRQTVHARAQKENYYLLIPGATTLRSSPLSVSEKNIRSATIQSQAGKKRRLARPFFPSLFVLLSRKTGILSSPTEIPQKGQTCRRVEREGIRRPRHLYRPDHTHTHIYIHTK